MSCENRRRVVTVPVVVEPVVAPVPPTVVPVQITNVEVAIGVAVVYTASSRTLPVDDVYLRGGKHPM